jgi:hypothetical protein
LIEQPKTHEAPPYQCAKFYGAITLRERQNRRKSQSYGSVTPTCSRGMPHFKSQDEIPMRGEDYNVPVFPKPKKSQLKKISQTNPCMVSGI